LQLESQGSQLSGAKTDHFYLTQIKFYSKRNMKILLKIRKSLHTVNALFQKSTCFCKYLKNRYILKILTDSDSASQGFYSEKVHKDKCKNKDTLLGYKNIEKHTYLGSE
jgi:hypothetical protein